MKHVSVSHHAVSRWSSRVNNDSPWGDIQQFIASGRVRPTPRGWMRGVAAAPGVTFMYSASFGGVCAVICDGVIVTFLTRALFAAKSTPSGRRERKSRRGGPTRRNPSARRAGALLDDLGWPVAA